MTETDERLRGIEDRLAHIEQIMQKVEAAVLPFLANPGKMIARMMTSRGSGDG